jgi:hypothetical protein
MPTGMVEALCMSQICLASGYSDETDSGLPFC